MLFECGLDHGVVKDPDTGQYLVLRWSHTKWIQLETYESFSEAYNRAMKLDLEKHGGSYLV